MKLHMYKRNLSALVDTIDPAWPIVQDWIRDAVVSVEVLPVEQQRAEATLLELQVTTRSPLGAIAFETGGIILDHGWLRILGSGHEKMQGNLLFWNFLEKDSENPRLRGALIIAHDVIGGFFA